jgi:diguanylate cyclase (GGDEF)-like protein
MDTHTLIVMNVLLYVLYAGMIVLSASMTGIAKGALWFAGSNLSRGVGLLVLGLGAWLPLSLQAVSAVSGLLAVSGIMMLHFSFASLLDRSSLLRSLQYMLMATMVVGMVYLLFAPSIYPVAPLLACSIEAAQIAATISVVLLFSGEEMGLAAWVTGIALSAYAVLLLIRVVVMMRFGTPDYLPLMARTTQFWLSGTLIVNAVIAFGFMFLSAAKLRVELLWHAQVDELTGLLNRWALRRIALREISRCGRTKSLISVVMMDLDGLKLVNDSLGHGAGDTALQAVAEVLRETVRDQDAVARIGGDEFCILLPGLAEAATVAERLRLQVDLMAASHRGQAVRVFASLGVASSESCGLSWQRLLEQSDAALYQAKREGRNRVVAVEFIDASDSMEVLNEGDPED